MEGFFVGSGDDLKVDCVGVHRGDIGGWEKGRSRSGDVAALSFDHDVVIWSCWSMLKLVALCVASGRVFSRLSQICDAL